MVVGLATVSLQIPSAHSLKEKRSVVKRITSRLRDRFNVAVAEVDDHDAWGTATLGIVCISTRSDHARSLLDRAVRHIERSRLDLLLFDYRIEIL